MAKLGDRRPALLSISICGCDCRSRITSTGVYYLLNQPPRNAVVVRVNNSLRLTHAEHSNNSKDMYPRLLFAHFKVLVVGHQSCLRERYRQMRRLKATIQNEYSGSRVERTKMKNSLMSNAGASHSSMYLCAWLKRICLDHVQFAASQLHLKTYTS